MSKAFTKEDDDTGFTATPTRSVAVPAGPFHLTRTGAAALAKSTDPHVREALGRAEVLPAQEPSPARAALGVTVRVRVGHDDNAEERSYRLVSAEEHALLGNGCSIHSPVGRTLLGAETGDVRELRAPRGNEELHVVELVGERDV